MSSTTLRVFCPYNNYETCPRLKRTESPAAVRPFYIVDEDHPRGIVFLNRDEVLSLNTAGTENVQVSYEGDDVRIDDAFGNVIRMTRAYFTQLLSDIDTGVLAHAMDNRVAV
jgi:hypothetical protein